jgi:hypothetical protein
MISSQWKPSAGKIASGIVLLVIGQWIFTLGQQVNLNALLRDEYHETAPGTWLSVLGIVCALSGLIALAVGLWQMATNADLAGLVAARALWVREQEQKAKDAERAGSPGPTKAAE